MTLSVTEMEPSVVFVHSNLGLAYLGKSMYEEALIEFQREREVSRGANTWAEVGAGFTPPILAGKGEWAGFTHVQMGKPDEAQKVLDDLLDRSKNEYVSPFLSACLHFVLGKNDEGFKLLNKAYKEHDHRLCHVKIVLLIDGIRSDPRYTALLKKRRT